MRKKVVKISLLLISLIISITIPMIAVTAKKKEWILAPIYIDESIPGVTWADWATQPWLKGSGTEEEPYMIKNVVISGEGSAFCIMIVNSEAFFKIKDSTFYNTKPPLGERNSGLVLLNTQNGVIFKNTFFDNGWIGSGQGAGIGLIGSNYNTIKKNHLSQNGAAGIYLEFSNYNIITENDCRDNFGTGIVVESSHSNIISKNDCSKNSATGIAVMNLYGGNSQNNILYGNTVKHNGIGIYFSYVDDNDAFRNVIEENDNGLIVDWGCENNLIYQNTFIDNNLQGWDYQFWMNNWYHPFMFEGNYWNDYTGTDSDGDGIGDTPWPYPGFDGYPFMEREGWEDLTPMEEEILNVFFYPDFNRLGASRTVHANKTSYLIAGIGQLFSERIYESWNPPYTMRLWFNEVEINLQGNLWYFEEESSYSEPAWFNLYYAIFPPYYLLEAGFSPGWNEFQWEISFYIGGEQQFMALTSYFYLV